MYLYEIIEDYQAAKSQEEKDRLFLTFCSSIWSSGNKRKTYTKAVKFRVRKDLADMGPGPVFRQWSSVEYLYYKPVTADDEWSSILRQKINNLYTQYFDRDVILEKEYMDLIKTPSRLYHQWAAGKSNESSIDAASAEAAILEAIRQSELVKARLQMRKMELSWEDYKKLIEGFLHRCLDNCRLIGDYEDKSSLPGRLDFVTEDHFYGAYISRCLDGELRKWQKRQCGLPQNSRKGYKRCKKCQTLILNTGNKRMYCTECAASNERERKRKIASRCRCAK